MSYRGRSPKVGFPKSFAVEWLEEHYTYSMRVTEATYLESEHSWVKPLPFLEFLVRRVETLVQSSSNVYCFCLLKAQVSH